MSYKFILFILIIVQRSTDPFHLLFCSFLFLKILTTIFSSKILYIKFNLPLKKTDKFYHPSDFVSHKFPIRSIVIKPRYHSSTVEIARSTLSVLVFAIIDRPSQPLFASVRHHLRDDQDIIKQLSTTQTHFIPHSSTSTLQKKGLPASCLF